MAELTVPQVNFSSLGDLPQVYREARMQANRQQTLADLGNAPGGLDYAAAAKRLLAAGDVQGATTLAHLGNSDRAFNFQVQEAQRSQANNERDFGFRNQEAGRAQSNTDRSFTLQQKQAEEKPQYMKDENGNIIQIDPFGKGAKVLPITGAGPATNPYANGKMNETQNKDALYSSRMMNAERIFDNPAVIEAGLSRTQRVMSKTPGFGNSMVSNEYQKFDQAQRDFINATLRRESGAAISASEFDNAEKQYFPQPGDSKEVLEQKKQNRREAIRGFASGAGQGYRPDYVFGPNGEIVPNPAPARGQQQPKPISSKADFDALPSGSTFTAPDGSIRVKP